MENVKGYLAQHVLTNDTLIVGVSGGPDSTALLDVLADFCKKRACGSLIVAHINHGIRGAEADRDEKFVRELAKSYGLRYEVKRVKLAGKTGLEERGRKIRREFFEKLRTKYKAKWILTAHTEDDQLETIIFNFLRGSGPAGLAGMKIANGFYLKPLLNTPKSEILAYLKSRKLAFRVDSMNNDTRLRRVFIRKKILPLLAKINPSFRKTLTRNAEIFRTLNEWTIGEADAFLDRHKYHSLFSFPRKDYLKLSRILRTAVLQRACQHFTSSSYRFPSVRITELERLVERNIGKKSIAVSRGKWVSLNKGKIFFHSTF